MVFVKRSHTSFLVKVLVSSLAICCLIGLYYGFRLMVYNEAIPHFGQTFEHAAEENPGHARIGSSILKKDGVLDQGVPPNAIHVMIVSSNNRLGGAIALMNSIIQNTQKPVYFHIITDNATKYHLHAWMNHPKLNNITYEVITFPAEWVTGKIQLSERDKALVYAKLYPTKLIPFVKGTLIYLDDDIIVQGDISKLADMPMPKKRIGLFSQDCDSYSKRYNTVGTKYFSYVDVKSPALSAMHLNGSSCVLNLGVFVINTVEWKNQNITKTAEHWMEVNMKENIFKTTGPLPPLLIALFNKTFMLDPRWHVRNLGVTSGTSHSKKFISSAKLLHWSGHFKPWGTHASHSEIWNKYYIPDPTTRFRPARKYRFTPKPVSKPSKS